MASTKTITNKTTEKKVYRVREGLVCCFSESKTYMPGEQLELSAEEYELHKLVLETEDQYQARQSGEDNTNISGR